jgi:hypothetical protein
VGNHMSGVAKHSQALPYPSELVTSAPSIAD